MPGMAFKTAIPADMQESCSEAERKNNKLTFPISICLAAIPLGGNDMEYAVPYRFAVLAPAFGEVNQFPEPSLFATA
ncbi:hypothetical protein DU854_24605 [Salmonella enterica subsp. enterica]|nr:hypothetical protein [Salmonella enterica subsp. enterica serovar Typhimurium]